MKKLISIVAVFAAMALPNLASAQSRPGHNDRPDHDARDVRHERMECSTEAATEWLTLDKIAAKLKDQNFKVLKIETKAGCYEAKVTDANGVALELHLDAVTAEIVRRRERS